MPRGWEGNRRSGVALAMHHGLSGLSTYGLNSHRKGDEHPAFVMQGLYLLLFSVAVCLSLSVFMQGG